MNGASAAPGVWLFLFVSNWRQLTGESLDNGGPADFDLQEWINDPELIVIDDNHDARSPVSELDIGEIH